MRFGIDYAWGGPPSAAALRRAHVAFVGRYFSLDPSKNVSRGEYEQLRRHGVDVIVAWETTATRALSDAVAGRADAITAEAERVKCGMPAEQVIYFAVDFDAQGPELERYFAGAHAHLGARTGAYGGYKAIKWLFDRGLIHHGWQTYAWSQGRWDARAHVRQYSNGHTLGGVDVDYDVEIPVAAPSKPHPPAGPYVPSDERNWRREYDRLVSEHRAPARRAWLRVQMRRREQLIRRLAHKTGWETLNRTHRYMELVRRAR